MAPSMLKPWDSGDGLLGCGTWLFAEPQPHLRRIIDLSGMGWPPLAVSEQGLEHDHAERNVQACESCDQTNAPELGATCTVAQLAAAKLPASWNAAPLFWLRRDFPDGMSRSVALNVHWFRVAVHRRTGEINILNSIHAADAGVVINPMQCHGQVEGGIAVALGAALFEVVEIASSGQAMNRDCCEYHIPSYADIPRSSVDSADTFDTLGPAGAKSMSGSPVNPIAAALSNAIRDATGVRCMQTAMEVGRLYRQIAENVST